MEARVYYARISPEEKAQLSSELQAKAYEIAVKTAIKRRRDEIIVRELRRWRT